MLVKTPQSRGSACGRPTRPTSCGGLLTSGCNSTHVARARAWWKRFKNRTARRTGTWSKKFQSMKRRGGKPPVQSNFSEDEE